MKICWYVDSFYFKGNPTLGKTSLISAESTSNRSHSWNRTSSFSRSTNVSSLWTSRENGWTSRNASHSCISITWSMRRSVYREVFSRSTLTVCKGKDSQTTNRPLTFRIRLEVISCCVPIELLSLRASCRVLVQKDIRIFIFWPMSSPECNIYGWFWKLFRADVTRNQKCYYVDQEWVTVDIYLYKLISMILNTGKIHLKHLTKRQRVHLAPS